MKLIVGLGNPGIEYEKTRHNTGFMALDTFAKKNSIKIDKIKFNGLYSQIILNDEKIILLKPLSFINLSGEVIKKYMQYFKIAINDVLIICDDMDLEVGTFKLRYKGGSAGHNGLKNIELNLGTNEYKRLKIGISKNKDISTVDYVLGKFNKEELKIMESLFIDIAEVMADFSILSFENLMNKYN